jgi:hypothetical protein
MNKEEVSNLKTILNTQIDEINECKRLLEILEKLKNNLNNKKQK